MTSRSSLRSSGCKMLSFSGRSKVIHGGTQLGQLATQFGAGQLHHPVAAQHHLADAAQALAQATGGHVGGAITLTLSQSQ